MAQGDALVTDEHESFLYDLPAMDSAEGTTRESGRPTFAGRAPRRIVADESIDRIAVDGSYIYWSKATDTNIYFANKNGGAGTSISAGATLHTPIVARDGYVYFINNGQLVRSPPAQLATVTLLSAPTSTVSLFAVDSLHAYWTDANRRLFQVLLSGGPSTDVTPTGLDLAPDKGATLFADNGVSGYIYYAHNPIHRRPEEASLGHCMAQRKGAPIRRPSSSPRAQASGAFTQDEQAIYYTTYGWDGVRGAIPEPYSAVWQISK